MGQDLNQYLDVLRKKWTEVPASARRVDTRELSALSDSDMLKWWSEERARAITGKGFASRGWYHALYSPILNQKKVLDVGSGLGFDGVSFAESGAEVTFLDIVESNLTSVRRVCSLLGIEGANFLHLEKIESLESLQREYDVIWCQGSLINAPRDVIRQEAQALLRHLKPAGRWIELAYPKTRWQREGKLPFERWGEKTDGGAPWIEWYDLEKLLYVLRPSRFEPILNFEFHDNDFIWFDLLRSD